MVTLDFVIRMCQGINVSFKGMEGFYDFTRAISNAFFNDITFKGVLHIVDHPVVTQAVKIIGDTYQG